MKLMSSGYLLGNPVTDLTFDRNKIVPFCHGMGLIPDELYESLKRSCGGNYIQIEPTNVQCLKDMQLFHKILDPQPPIPTVGCRVSIEKWQRCKYDLPYLFQVQSSIPYHAFLSKKRLSIFDIQVRCAVLIKIYDYK
ncbi:hypothetical protein NE237_023475 [Protea cynaroides]|uniref:Uncharacterized protein n=1 Tax=Protea cynaroides TaxID=273540 RepID=A0A9Q0HE36_9MAGN|nr:hypothetical protein NE237_023475 [Protea cynaroides]